MRSAVFALACAMAAGNVASHDAPWIGVWRAFLDGQPSATLTLANDAGTIGGTLVLDIVVNHDGKTRVTADEVHVLVGARMDGNTLRFGVRRRDGKAMTFTVVLGDDGNVKLHCVSCGNAPVVEMTKEVFGRTGSD
ncbi:MAG TPA: hypothetical protein VKR52_03075 [Terracidiphilus sp.]|nr:hypothetical protein [Terracidiphilus sp.]